MSLSQYTTLSSLYYVRSSMRLFSMKDFHSFSLRKNEITFLCLNVIIVRTFQFVDDKEQSQRARNHYRQLLHVVVLPNLHQ